MKETEPQNSQAVGASALVQGRDSSFLGQNWGKKWPWHETKLKTYGVSWSTNVILECERRPKAAWARLKDRVSSNMVKMVKKYVLDGILRHWLTV